MDRKSLIILVIAVVLFMVWGPLTNMIYPPKPAPRTNMLAQATNQLPGTNLAGATSAPPTISSAPATLLQTNLPAAPTNQPPLDEQTVMLESSGARYTFTSAGGGLKLIELKNYPHYVGCIGTRKVDTNELAKLNTKAPLPVLAVVTPGSAPMQESFTLTKTGNHVRAERELGNGLFLVKEFELSTNYLIKTRIRYENRSSAAVSIPEREVVIGTATPMSHHDETLTLGLEWYNGNGTEKVTEGWFANRMMGCGPGSPRTVYQGGASNVVWAAVHNRFFTIIAVPDLPAPQVVGRRVDLPPPTREEVAQNPKAVLKPFGYQTALFFPASSVPTQHALEQRFDLFAGPKEYTTLSKLPRDMDLAMGFGRFFGIFAKALLVSMNWIHNAGPGAGIPYGIVIIIITVIIKLLFWPLTQASNRSMKRLGALQPQMKALQEKYKDDPKKMNQKLMEFMRENKVNPMGGCIPILIQIPVFIGFYQMLQSAIELRGARFLWACDLAEPDTIFYFIGFPVNPMPLLMAGTMLWQARLTPPSPGMDPVQQKMMQYMPLIFVFMLYNFSAGLTLYWTVQNLLSIVQMKLTHVQPQSKPGQPPAPAKAVAPPRKR